MVRKKPQLRPYFGVLGGMGSVSQISPERASLKWDMQRGPQMVSAPPPHEGVRRALLGSFGSIPAMPEEFTRLLDKLR